MKLLSEYDMVYYNSDLWRLLDKLEHGNKLYTHALVVSSTFSSNKPLLRRCLRTLESLGLCNNFNEGFNIHRWQITDKGKAAIEKYRENNWLKIAHFQTPQHPQSFNH